MRSVLRGSGGAGGRMRSVWRGSTGVGGWMAVGAAWRTKSAIHRLTGTGCRAGGRWPAPAIRINRPRVSSANRAPAAGGAHRSSSPWMTRTGQCTPRSTASIAGRPGTDRGASSPAISVSGPVSRAQDTQSSYGLVECGSGSSVAKNHSTKPR